MDDPHQHKLINMITSGSSNYSAASYNMTNLERNTNTTAGQPNFVTSQVPSRAYPIIYATNRCMLFGSNGKEQYCNSIRVAGNSLEVEFKMSNNYRNSSGTVLNLEGKQAVMNCTYF